MITGSVIGGDQLVQRLKSMPGGVQAELRRAVARIAIKVQRHVVTNKLTGQVLHVRTGTLRRSINQRVVVEPGRVLGIVGTNVWYGRLHEFGELVKAHERVITMVFGKPLKNGPKAIKVKEYRMPERSFLRSALDDMQDTIRRELEDAVKKGMP